MRPSDGALFLLRLPMDGPAAEDEAANEPKNSKAARRARTAAATAARSALRQVERQKLVATSTRQISFLVVSWCWSQIHAPLNVPSDVGGLLYSDLSDYRPSSSRNRLRCAQHTSPHGIMLFSLHASLASCCIWPHSPRQRRAFAKSKNQEWPVYEISGLRFFADP